MTSASLERSGLRGALEKLLEGRDLDARTADELLGELIDAATPPALQAAFLTALRMKGVTADELAGLARGLLVRARAVPRCPRPLIDTAGTGGDGRASFNLSTAAALVLAALGLGVAKHGNRAVSSRSGSADLIEVLGIPLLERGEEVARALERHGFAFLHAPGFHPATAALAGLRRALGLRTVFNLLGPLVNPARPEHQLIGAATEPEAELLAGAAARLGLTAFVVHADGFDEATPCGPFRVHHARAGSVQSLRFTPEDFGLRRARSEDLHGGDAHANALELRALFAGAGRPALRDAVCLNAALVLLLVGRERDPRQAARAASRALDDGRAARLVARLAIAEVSA